MTLIIIGIITFFAILIAIDYIRFRKTMKFIKEIREEFYNKPKD